MYWRQIGSCVLCCRTGSSQPISWWASYYSLVLPEIEDHFSIFIMSIYIPACYLLVVSFSSLFFSFLFCKRSVLFGGMCCTLLCISWLSRNVECAALLPYSVSATQCPSRSLQLIGLLYSLTVLVLALKSRGLVLVFDDIEMVCRASGCHLCHFCHRCCLWVPDSGKK